MVELSTGITSSYSGIYRFLNSVRRRIHLIIGLTGGIGTGKTTAASILAKMGVKCIDVDRVAHVFLAPGSPVLDEIIAAFGKEFRRDGGIDRKRLGKLVFSRPEKRRKLEAIVHPLLKKEITRMVQAARGKGEDLVLDYALLFEMKMEDLVDEVWVVFLPRRLQAARVAQRDKLTIEEAEARIDAQWPLEEKAARAAVIIDNSGSIAELAEQIRRLWEERIRKGYNTPQKE